MTHISPSGVEILGHLEPGYRDILSHDALSFIAGLHRRFDRRRQSLLRKRKQRQDELDQGAIMIFPHETADIRASEWTVRPAPADLQDRRVEITGPVDRKMVVNALNSGAKCFMADFEDATAPLWDNLIQGQINLRDAIRREIDFSDLKSGKQYAVKDKAATLIVRPTRLASGRTSCADQWPADIGQPVRFRAVSVSQPRRAESPRDRPVFSICPSWKTVTRRGCGAWFSSMPRMSLVLIAARSAQPC